MKKANKNLGMPIVTDKELLKTYANQINGLRKENERLKDDIRVLREENILLNRNLDRAYESMRFS
jgi:predicted RNase H-like nuclease (RuvC/YqgF family)